MNARPSTRSRSLGTSPSTRSRSLGTRRLIKLLMPIVVVALLVPAVAIPLNARAQGGVDKSLFISVLDEAGKPVKDIVADDILIREDGVDRQVVAVKPPSQPISVAVLVDTAQGS